MSVRLSGCARVTFVDFTDCESFTRLTSTNPVSFEAGEYGLARETCYFARHLQVVAVAGLCGFRGVFWVRCFFAFSFFLLFFLPLHTACTSMRLRCLIYSLLVVRPFFALRGD